MKRFSFYFQKISNFTMKKNVKDTKFRVCYRTEGREKGDVT